MIFASINNDVPNLSEYYGDVFNITKEYPLENCEIVKRKQYNIDANWKLMIDNFIEYYHLPNIHPKLVKISGMEEHQYNQGKGMNISFKTDPLTSVGLPVDPTR